MLLDSIKANGIYIFNSLSQSVSSYVIRGSGLELEWQTLKCGLLPCNLINHLATALIWGQFLEPLLFSIEHTNACRTVHLMTAEGKEVAIHCLNIHLEVRRALGSINQNGDIMRVGNFYYLLNGINCTKHIAHVGHTD